MRRPCLHGRFEQTEAALRVLRTTPGIIDARALSTEEQRALLAPWFGPELDLDSLPVPQLIEVIAEEDSFDAAGLRLRLAAEVPGAVLDDLLETVFTVQNYVVLGLLMLSLATVAVIVLVFLLSQQLRRGEFFTLRRMGASRPFIAVLVASEIVFVFAASLALAAKGFSCALVDAADPAVLDRIAAVIADHRRTSWIDIHKLRAWSAGSRIQATISSYVRRASPAVRGMSPSTCSPPAGRTGR